MANLPETVQWEDGIYQLETTDPVEGGESGIDNVQAKLLANRTAYLKQQLEENTAQATTAKKGTAEIATQSEVDAGTDDLRIVTPKKLKSWVKQASESILGMLRISTQQQIDLGVNDSVAVSPKKLQQKLSDNCLGMGQNWVDMGLLRLLNVNYTNSTGRPIFIAVSAGDNNNGLVSYIHTRAIVDGVYVATSGAASIGSSVGFSVSFIVPAGSTYRVEFASDFAATVRSWAELR